MASPDFPFDAVLFDLDGTLVATDRYWPESARVGAARALRELGIERELPSDAEWMSMVGLAIETGFERVFADLAPADRAQVMRACLEEEQRALADGLARPLPGVTETLAELGGRGVRLGIASNCSRDYLGAMMQVLELGRWVEEALCLDSPGVRNKADMVAQLLLAFDTRSAVMVGDRLGDRDAAWANGLPHVHLARGYAARGEMVECEAVIEGLDRLVPRLEGRAEWLAASLDALGLPSTSCTVAVTGGLAAGKTLFARDLARVLERAGRAARVVALEEYTRDGSGEGWDLERLEREVLGPHRERDGEGVLLLEGAPLAHPDLAARVDRVVHLAVSDELALRRVAGRIAGGGGVAPGAPQGPPPGPGSLARVRDEILPRQRALERSHPPEGHADLVLDAGNPLGPLHPPPDRA